MSGLATLRRINHVVGEDVPCVCGCVCVRKERTSVVWCPLTFPAAGCQRLIFGRITFIGYP